MQRIAIIPARAGSKGLPGKNIRLLAGKPLIAHSIDAALDSGIFDGVLVTSDDERVLELAERMGAISIDRPKELAADDTPMAPVVLHVLGLEQCASVSEFVLLQPTSPLRKAHHIRECSKLFVPGETNTVVSVCPLEHQPEKALFVEDGLLQPMFSWDKLNQNRQSLKDAYRQNGAMWFVDAKHFIHKKRFVIAPAVPYIMSPADSIDIDTLEDFERAETLITQNARKAIHA